MNEKGVWMPGGCFLLLMVFFGIMALVGLISGDEQVATTFGGLFLLNLVINIVVGIFRKGKDKMFTPHQ